LTAHGKCRIIVREIDGAGDKELQDFREFAEKNIVIFDGAMGTRLYEKGGYINRVYDELNLSQPALLQEIHREYIAAGAMVIETNTFGANRFKLQPHGLVDKLEVINFQAAKLAREAAGDKAWVAGSIGPLGIRIEPWGKTSVEEAEAAFAEQAGGLLAGGVDLFILERFLTSMKFIRRFVQFADSQTSRLLLR
jgi:homocysteine S-methyltransferase